MTRYDIVARARMILDSDPDSVVRYRLLRDVLAPQASSALVEEAARTAWRSPQVIELALAQRADGSWGRFHSEEVAARARFPTTEYAIERALVLGLDGRHPLLARAGAYLKDVLDGRRTWPDPPERNDRWRTGVTLITGATLALMDPRHPSLDCLSDLWREIARRAFRSGDYDPRTEALAHRELTGASVRDSYLLVRGRPARPAILSRRTGAAPRAGVSTTARGSSRCWQGFTWTAGADQAPAGGLSAEAPWLPRRWSGSGWPGRVAISGSAREAQSVVAPDASLPPGVPERVGRQRPASWTSEGWKPQGSARG